MLRKSAAIGLAAAGLSLGLAYSAKADVVLPVTNLGFNVLTHPLTQQKDFFTTVQPTGWSVGTAGAGGSLIYVGPQGSESFEDQSHGNIYGVYSNPGFSDTVPAGTNFYQADGNPQYESTIMQTISGLTAGVTYDLSFQQAAGQQGYPTPFSGATTEQWKVFLGAGGIGVDCHFHNPCIVTGTFDNIEEDSTLMNTPSQGNTDWNLVNLSFTPTAWDLSHGTAVLTFLAWGNGGSTVNEPPTVFLEGVNTARVPEPASLSLLGFGLLGLGRAVRRRRANEQVA